MRFVQRDLWPCLVVLLLGGCSLVVDFPDPRDGGTGRDGGSVNCDPKTHKGCQDDELCCEVSDNRKLTCVPKSADKCTSCGADGACTDPAANRCGKDGCECERDSGEACGDGQTCSTATDRAPVCVECNTDSDCASLGATAQCVGQQCLACDRKDPSNPGDDEGCDPTTPVCDETNTCIGCRNDGDCPAEQQCISEQGCFGCSITKPIGDNGCNSPTSPVCKQTVDGFQCGRCENDAECMTGNFCDERTGACTPACNPGGPYLANGCTNPTRGFCKEAATGGFECSGCAAADCMGAAQFCVTADGLPTTGQCVACRANSECPAGQVCDPTTNACRAQGQMDCMPPTPAFNGTACVQCTTDANCAGTPATPRCNTVTNTCVRCTTAAHCASTTSTPSATPICASNTCVPCTLDSQCRNSLPATPQCVIPPSGMSLPPTAVPGSCAACVPVAGSRGCDPGSDTPFCSMLGAVPTCTECTPLTGICPNGTAMCTAAGTCPRAGTRTIPGFGSR